MRASPDLCVLQASQRERQLMISRTVWSLRVERTEASELVSETNLGNVYSLNGVYSGPALSSGSATGRLTGFASCCGTMPSILRCA